MLITGERRSGTTLLANFLNSQDEFTVYRDFLHVERLQRSLGGVDLETALSLHQRLRLLGTFDDWTSMLGIELDLCADEFSSLLDFYTYVLEMIAQPGDVVVGHKTTMLHHLGGDLLQLVPDLKILFMLRDPRDLATSALKRFADEPATLHDYIEGWERSLFTIKRLFCDVRFSGRIFILRYEDFILETDQVLPHLATFLDDAAIRVPAAMTDYGSKWQENSAFGDLKQDFDATPIGRWREYNPEAGRIAEVLLAKSMQECGYELSAPISDEERSRTLLAYESHRMKKLGMAGMTSQI